MGRRWRKLWKAKRFTSTETHPCGPCLARWRQQLNENSKLLANVEVFPEMNHNELVGWESGNEACVAVLPQDAR